MSSEDRLLLSPPHMAGGEGALIQDAFRSNWIAPLGPHVDAFENEFRETIGAPHAVALSSGTAALHLALQLAGVTAGDEVIVSTFTFAASAFPVLYQAALPIFVDSELVSWNMDPWLLAEVVEQRVRSGRIPKAVVVVHLYGQSADLAPIVELCNRHGIVLIEDAAEALGATYNGKACGTAGHFGVFSFNGNKIITTSGGGMLVSPDGEAIERGRMLATQARDAAPHYQHSNIGYNYRLSNLLAAVGRGQLRVLGDRVAARRAIFDRYNALLSDLPGIQFMPEAEWGQHTRWLTTVLINPDRAGFDRETARQALEEHNIEARPVWKPMHLQPVFEGYPVYGGAVSEGIFRDGLCLPSGSNMQPEDVERVASVLAGLVK
jgi:dTDP-4-amino-4,6-dideoxygalactose transaminase